MVTPASAQMDPQGSQVTYDVTPEAKFPPGTKAETCPSAGLYLQHRYINLESEKPAECGSLWVERVETSQPRPPSLGAGDPSPWAGCQCGSIRF